MKILALVTDAFGGSGGIAQYNRDFLRALAGAAGIERVDVLPLVRPTDEELHLPEGIGQWPAPASRAAYVAKAMRLIFTGRYDMIYCGHLNLAPVSAALAGLARIPFVAQLHGIEIWSVLAPLRRWALERARAILCVSRDTRRRTLAATDVAPERVHVLPNTVDPAFTPGDRDAARRRFGLAHERVLATVGRLDAREAYKGHDRVIAALPDLLKDMPDLVYLIGGSGNDQARLEGLARDAGVVGAVRFLGHVPGEALADLYRAADAFVMPSTGEGFGIVYLEAMACGTPAVGLSVGGAPDALGDGRLGHVADHDELARVIRRALALGNGRSALSDAVEERFGWPRFREHVQALVPSWHNSPTHRTPQTA